MKLCYQLENAINYSNYNYLPMMKTKGSAQENK